MPTRKRLIAALTLSSTIYLVPVVTAHWIDLFGLVLGHELFRDREPAWKAADVALALIVQAARVRVRVVGGAPAQSCGRGCHGAAADSRRDGVELRLPVRDSLVLSDRARYDAGHLCVERRVRGRRLLLDPVRQGISRGLERRGETWVRQDNGTQYGILRVPGCAVEPVAIPELPIAPGLQQALPDGSVVYTTMERGVAGQQYWLLRRGIDATEAARGSRGPG